MEEPIFSIYYFLTTNLMALKEYKPKDKIRNLLGDSIKTDPMIVQGLHFLRFDCKERILI
jgi:hypothetical protein